MQDVLFQAAALRHIALHRQVGERDAEAGGQLFGKVSAELVEVVQATGPYLFDRRSRYSYQSSARAAQRAIDRQHRLGCIYLGEWHTHPEDRPAPSLSDYDAVARLARASLLYTSSILLLIQGRVAGSEGVSLTVLDLATGERRQLISSDPTEVDTGFRFREAA